jgi:hypothetical protein
MNKPPLLPNIERPNIERPTHVELSSEMTLTLFAVSIAVFSLCPGIWSIWCLVTSLTGIAAFLVWQHNESWVRAIPAGRVGLITKRTLLAWFPFFALTIPALLVTLAIEGFLQFLVEQLDKVAAGLPETIVHRTKSPLFWFFTEEKTTFETVVREASIKVRFAAYVANKILGLLFIYVWLRFMTMFVRALMVIGARAAVSSEPSLYYRSPSIGAGK